jgi:Cu(I)/Ag(I) efflux system membrane fusion protein
VKHLELYTVAIALVFIGGAGALWPAGNATNQSVHVTVATKGDQQGPATTSARSAAGQPVLYYRDPDGKPVYSDSPRRTDDGRDFVAVHDGDEGEGGDALPPTEQRAAARQPDGERRVVYYRNPMGLPDRSPAPKKDSMGMDYIPVYEGEDAGDSAIRLEPGKIQRTGVRTEAVERRSLQRPIIVPGIVQLDERRISVVTARSDSFLVDVADITTGENVKKGQSLVTLYAPEITAAAAQFFSSLKSNQEGAVKSARQRLVDLGVTPQAIRLMEKTGEAPAALTWTAPANGILISRKAARGMMIRAGEEIFRLADTSSLWVIADVPERDLGAVRVGAEASIKVKGLPGASIAGRVSLVYPEVAPETRTGRVRIEIANADLALRVNMYADVEIIVGDGRPVASVSESAVIDSGTRQLVIVDRREGRFEPRPVKIGMRGNGLVEILDGVKPGDRVVVAGNFLIDAESNLKAALGAMATSETTK